MCALISSTKYVHDVFTFVMVKNNNKHLEKNSTGNSDNSTRSTLVCQYRAEIEVQRLKLVKKQSLAGKIVLIISHSVGSYLSVNLFSNTVTQLVLHIWTLQE